MASWAGLMRFGGSRISRGLRVANLIGLAMGLLALCAWNSPCDAGVIIPQAEASDSIELGISPVTPSDQDVSDDRDASVDQLSKSEIPALDRRGESRSSDGSRSSSGSGTGGSGNNSQAAASRLDRHASLIVSRFFHWREMSPRLPRPRAERLLDPPKARA